MKKNIATKICSIILIAVWICVISGFSGEDSKSSNNTSSKVTEIILDKTVSDFSDMPEHEQKELVKKTNPVVRKAAHFTEYAILGFLISMFFVFSGTRGLKPVIYTAAFCLIFSSADEIHQSFVPGRSCQFTDILIDTLGGALGAFLVFLFLKVKRRLSCTAKNKG